jgi:hypothetical protein
MRTTARHFSPHNEFDETAPLREAVYLGRPNAYAPPPLRLLGCGCGKRHLQRIDRLAWMRLLLPGFGLYFCMRCLKRVLRPRARVRGPGY